MKKLFSFSFILLLIIPVHVHAVGELGRREFIKLFGGTVCLPALEAQLNALPPFPQNSSGNIPSFQLAGANPSRLQLPAEATLPGQLLPAEKVTWLVPNNRQKVLSLVRAIHTETLHIKDTRYPNVPTPHFFRAGMSNALTVLPEAEANVSRVLAGNELRGSHVVHPGIWFQEYFNMRSAPHGRITVEPSTISGLVSLHVEFPKSLIVANPSRGNSISVRFENLYQRLNTVFGYPALTRGRTVRYLNFHTSPNQSIIGEALRRLAHRLGVSDPQELANWLRQTHRRAIRSNLLRQGSGTIDVPFVLYVNEHTRIDFVVRWAKRGDQIVLGNFSSAASNQITTQIDFRVIATDPLAGRVEQATVDALAFELNQILNNIHQDLRPS